MKCVYELPGPDADTVGCANTRDLIHSGTVPRTICNACPYRKVRRWSGIGDAIHAAFSRTGVAAAYKRLRKRGCGCSKRQHWLNRLLPFRKRPDNGNWSVVVTTAPRAVSTLQQCIASIRLNGWEPVLFAEPGSEQADCLTFENDKRLGVWHNWLKSCRWALEHTDAEYILTVQDDSVFHHESRQLMEELDWPSKAAFVSLYTPKHYGKGETGLKRVKTRSMWGACALVWRRDVLRQVIDHKIARSWLGVPPRGRLAQSVMQRRRQNPALVQNSDTAIGRICNALRLDMYFVLPSPVRHVATHSSISHGGNTGKRNCGSCADHSRPLRQQVSSPAS